jgi:hypothetical protein
VRYSSPVSAVFPIGTTKSLASTPLLSIHVFVSNDSTSTVMKIARDFEIETEYDSRPRFSMILAVYPDPIRRSTGDSGMNRL